MVNEPTKQSPFTQVLGAFLNALLDCIYLVTTKPLPSQNVRFIAGFVDWFSSINKDVADHLTSKSRRDLSFLLLLLLLVLLLKLRIEYGALD